MSINRETPVEYAQRRANETRTAYMVTGMGHAMCVRGNIALTAILGGVASIHKPQRKVSRS